MPSRKTITHTASQRDRVDGDAASSRATLLEILRNRRGMFLMEGTYGEACALIVGYDVATSGGFLDGFGEWLAVIADRESHLTWWLHALAITHGVDDARKVVLVSAAEHHRAIIGLADLLERFRRELDRHGRREIFRAYLNWRAGKVTNKST